MENALTKLLEATKDIIKDNTELNRLRHLYLLECHLNLKILNVARNKRLEKAHLYRLLSHLTNESSKLFYSSLSGDIINKIFRGIRLVKDSNKDYDSSLLLSIINKIEVIKILSQEFNELEDSGVIRINARVNNLYRQLEEIVTTFSEEINKKL